MRSDRAPQIGRDLQGVILDMRSNRGGLLDQAVGLEGVHRRRRDLFEPGRHPRQPADPTRRQPQEVAAELPMVVLVNGNSASAARDRGRPPGPRPLA